MTLAPANSHPRGLPLGLAGATVATRYVGGTASVAPTTGTFAVGDYVVTSDGKEFVCTAAGTPGTWVQVGASFTPGPFAYFQSSGGRADGDYGVWTPINNVAYPNNVANAALLFDLSTPTEPAAVSTGVYAVSFENSSAQQLTKTMGAFLYFDSTGTADGPGLTGQPLNLSFNIVTVTGVRALTAGMKLQAQVVHDIGGSPTIGFWALVQRIA